jgi:hypothetical protein
MYYVVRVSKGKGDLCEKTDSVVGTAFLAHLNPGACYFFGCQPDFACVSGEGGHSDVAIVGLWAKGMYQAQQSLY